MTIDRITDIVWKVLKESSKIDEYDDNKVILSKEDLKSIVEVIRGYDK